MFTSGKVNKFVQTMLAYLSRVLKHRELNRLKAFLTRHFNYFSYLPFYDLLQPRRSFVTKQNKSWLIKELRGVLVYTVVLKSLMDNYRCYNLLECGFPRVDFK